MSFREKIIPWDRLPAWRAELRANGRQLVVTNGCFDVLHLGHVSYLEGARNQGDALLVGVNSDAGVRELKGPGRPVNSAGDRAAVVAALASVDAVCIFEERSAVTFLAVAKPDIYVKGGDYTREALPADECAIVEKMGGRIVIVPAVPGMSSTALLARIARL